ncbi:MAG TPA: hypothetical protein VFB04_16205 [Terriglobales bacterium]|nr:hypothetical protein [Terriglobales bacterium]
MPNPKPISAAYETLVQKLHETRAEVLGRLEEEKRRAPQVQRDRKLLAQTEAQLAIYDLNFHQTLTRLVFLKPLQAATVLLMENDNEPMLEGDLIDLMLAHGVCLGNEDPRGDILRSFSRDGTRKKLHFENGYVSISREYYDTVARKKG